MKKQKCVNCGKTFVLTDSEIAFFESKNLKLPKRCIDCRKQKNKIKERSKKNLFIKLFEKIQIRGANLEKIQNSLLLQPSMAEQIAQFSRILS